MIILIAKIKIIYWHCLPIMVSSGRLHWIERTANLIVFGLTISLMSYSRLIFKWVHLKEVAAGSGSRGSRKWLAGVTYWSIQLIWLMWDSRTRFPIYLIVQILQSHYNGSPKVVVKNHSATKLWWVITILTRSEWEYICIIYLNNIHSNKKEKKKRER